MAFGAIADISTNSLKIAFPPKAVETMIQEEIEFRPRLKRSLPPGARITDGYEIRFSARLAPSQNVAQIADTGNFPIPKEAIDRMFVFKPSIFAGSYHIGGLTRYVANSNTVAYNGGEQRRRPEEVMSNFGKLIESTYVGTAGDGIRGYVESDGTNTVVVKASGSTAPQGLTLLPKNAYISIRQSAGGAVRDSIDLRSIDERDLATRTLTYSGADQTAVAGDPIYIVSESALAGATLAAIPANGVRGQIDDGTLSQYIHTLDRTLSGNSELKSYVNSAAGERRNLTEQLLISSNHEVGFRAKKKPSTLLLGMGQVEKYIEFVAPQRRWNIQGSGTQGKTTGYNPKELRHDAPGVSLDFMMSYDCLPGEVYGISWDAFFFYSALDAQWLSGNEAALHLLPGTNGSAHRFAWGSYMVSIENWGTDFPLAHFVIRDLKDRLLGD
jgi:hypothetical protein